MPYTYHLPLHSFQCLSGMPFLNRVLRPIEPDKALLNASPYLLLGGWLLCMMLVIGVPLSGESTSWQIARWVLRIVNLALFLYAWFARSEDEVRPDWMLSWLGFALYEVTGIGLLGVTTLVNSSWPNGGVGVLILPLALCAFIPWIIVCTWVGSRNQQAARLIVFPHAALTAPLFLAALEFWPPESEMALYWAVLVTILVAGGFTALYEAIPPQRRAVWLYVAVVLCQSIQTLLGLYAEIGGLVVIAAVLMSMLGMVILSTPFILSGIWSKISKVLTNRGIISPQRANPNRLGSDP